MQWLGSDHLRRGEHKQAVEWTTKAAEAGVPAAMHHLGCCLDAGQGVAAPDHPAAADWYRRAADAGSAEAAVNLSDMFSVGRGRVPQIVPATFLHILDSRFLS
jgi:TPR repeat protein